MKIKSGQYSFFVLEPKLSSGNAPREVDLEVIIGRILLKI